MAMLKRRCIGRLFWERRSWRSVLRALIGTAALVPALRASAADSSPHIVFLTLHWETNTLSLLRADIVPGTLKPGPEVLHGVSFHVQNAAGTILQTGQIGRPWVRHYEVGDPGRGGAITSKIVEFPSAKFTLRIPYDPAATTIEFVDPEQGRTPSRSLGRVALPAL
jgi:hypothetical protein